MAADEALQQQCAAVDCARKTVEMLTRQTSALTVPDLWPPNRMAFGTSVVIIVLFHLLAWIESEIKIFTRTNITVNMAKVLIKILQGNVVRETRKVG